MHKVSELVQNFLVIGFLVLLVGVASYTSLALTPVVKKPSVGSVAGASSNVQQDFVATNKLPLEFRALRKDIQLVEQGAQIEAWQSLGPDQNQSRIQLLEVYNPNNFPVDSRVTVKVPVQVESALLVDLLDINEIKQQLHAPKLADKAVQKVSIPAKGTQILEVEAIKLSPINFPVSLTYSVNY